MNVDLKPKDISQLENAADNLRDTILARCCFRLRCSIREILAITINDIDFVQKCIFINRSSSCTKLSCPNCGRRIWTTFLFCAGCGNAINNTNSETQEKHHQREIRLDDDTSALLKEYISRGGLVEKNGKQFLFNVGRHRAWQILKVSIKKAGLA